jgi:hypothetical protein
MRLQKLALLWMLKEKVGNFGKEKSESRRKKSENSEKEKK